MNKNVEHLLRADEKISVFLFAAFAFSIFSCLFPTGFSATFSTLSFMFALPVFYRKITTQYLSPPEKIGLILFGWLSLSLLWSETELVEGLSYLSEYRLYLLIPFFSLLLTNNKKSHNLVLCCMVIGALIALIFSYLLGWRIIWIYGSDLSLANRIFHGFIMSSLLVFCLSSIRQYEGWKRLFFLIVSSFIVYNILNIEKGRTGYLQVLCVLVLFIFLNMRLRSAIVFGCISIFVFSIGLSHLEKFNKRIQETTESFWLAYDHGDFKTSTGSRFEFYRSAIDIGLENPLTGVGVGDLVNELNEKFMKGDLQTATNNVHSEFLNMFAIGGFPAIFLFASFVISIGLYGFRLRKLDRYLGEIMIGLAVVVCVSAIFNSTIKDYGEKHALILMLSLAIARAKLIEMNIKSGHAEIASKSG